MLKRMMDFTISVLFLILFSPVLCLLCLAIRYHLGSPIFFTQVRPGLNEKPFKLIKFRTMTDAIDEKGQLLPDELRLTRLGRFLRSTSLDELPELWNVLKGEMSLVGPRPLLLDYLPLYSPEQRRRHHVRPGLTGWAQINGRNAISWQEKFKLDVWYVDHQSLILDCKILCLTVFKVFKREGIHAEGHVTIGRFEGTD
jgi:sugar transferase EpsL